MIDTNAIAYADTHRNADTHRLLLCHSQQALDMAEVAQQIEGWRQATEKWPLLAQQTGIYYPPRINREQSSSQATALYKSKVAIAQSSTVADLTGGMGIDTLAATTKADSVHYIEQNPLLCHGMQHNLMALGIKNCHVHNVDSIEWLQHSCQQFDTIIIDPARRDSEGQRVYAFEHCTPNLLMHLPLLLSRCHTLLIKASPMIDLTTAWRQIGGSVDSTHIVAVRGECKEVLLLCKGEYHPTSQNNDPTIVCVNLDNQGDPIHPPFEFTTQQEANATAHLCDEVRQYLYEPHAALMKAAPFKLLGQRYDMEMLGLNSHMYTSQQSHEQFPGRCFEVERLLPSSRKAVAQLIPNRCAHVICRNYPLTATTLQKKLGLSEGGQQYIIGSTIAGKPQLMLCHRLY